jgi:CheY-like chemotaxis protein
MANHPSAKAPSKKHLLVVDDDSDNRGSLAMLLAANGMQVSQCESGKAALAELAHSNGIDLIVSDVSMPEMDGVEFAARAHELRPDVPLLLLTGHDSLVDEVIAQGSMALLKPYEPELLLGLVEEMVARSLEARSTSPR